MTERAASRRKAREAALKALYARRVGGAYSHENLQPEAQSYADRLMEGAYAEHNDYDKRIGAKLRSGWTVERIAIIDHLIILLSLHELETEAAVPPRVTISEAGRLAARFGSKESPKFVQGVLGALLPETAKAEWTPADAPEPEPEAAEPDPQEEQTADEEEQVEYEIAPGGWILKRED